MTISQWAERNRVIPKGSSARPGPWRTESYQREILDALLNPDIREVVCMKSTQVGWSEVLNNVVGYFIDIDPKPMLFIQPTDLTARDYSKKRIAPMIANCPTLNSKVRQATSRRSGNTLLLKEFPGGFLKMAGANAGSGLRSDPIAVLLFDEMDGYPSDVDGEGDPVTIAERRTDTFDDAKILKGSTPAKPRGLSRIEEDFLRSDQRYYMVPCPFCGLLQRLEWKDPDTQEYRLVWEKDDAGYPIESTVRYICSGCRAPIEEKYKQRMLDAGQWEAQCPEHSVVGFHINALYSPWRMIWADLAREWVDAQDNPEKLQAFVNLRLAQTWNEGGDTFGPHVLVARKETYPAEVPAGGGVLVAAVDVQANWLEAQVIAFGAGEESWLVGYANEFYFNPDAKTTAENGMDSAWQDLDQFLLKQWRHESGALLSPIITLIDSGAHSDDVYDFVMPRQHTRRRVFSCKGMEHLAKPGLAAQGSTSRGSIRQWNIGTYAVKDRIFARMKIPKPGPGHMHFPDWTTDEYFRQLTGEKKITVRDKRTRTRKQIYVKTENRNEALDMTGYCHAALFILQNFIAPNIYRDLAKVVQSVNAQKDPEAVAVQPRRVRSLGVF